MNVEKTTRFGIQLVMPSILQSDRKIFCKKITQEWEGGTRLVYGRVVQNTTDELVIMNSITLKEESLNRSYIVSIEEVKLLEMIVDRTLHEVPHGGGLKKKIHKLVVEIPYGNTVEICVNNLANGVAPIPAEYIVFRGEITG